MSVRHRTAVTAIATATIATLLTGSVAAVQATSTPKPVKACADKKQNLKLKGRSGCPAGTHAVTLGAQGPAGTPGAPGAPGAPGGTGATGPSDAYVSHFKGILELPDSSAGTPSPKTVTSFVLPAGSYVLTASLRGEDVHNYRTYCYFDIGGRNSFTALFTEATNPSNLIFGVSFSDTAVLTSGATVSLICDHYADSSTMPADIFEAVLIATRVGALHGDGAHDSLGGTNQ